MLSIIIACVAGVITEPLRFGGTAQARKTVGTIKGETWKHSSRQERKFNDMLCYSCLLVGVAESSFSVALVAEARPHHAPEKQRQPHGPWADRPIKR